MKYDKSTSFIHVPFPIVHTDYFGLHRSLILLLLYTGILDLKYDTGLKQQRTIEDTMKTLKFLKLVLNFRVVCITNSENSGVF